MNFVRDADLFETSFNYIICFLKCLTKLTDFQCIFMMCGFSGHVTSITLDRLTLYHAYFICNFIHLYYNEFRFIIILARGSK